MKLAINNGITVIRILQQDVWCNKFDWETLLLDHIKHYNTPRVIYLTDTNIYKNHIELYENNSAEELANKIKTLNKPKKEELTSNNYFDDDTRIIVKKRKKYAITNPTETFVKVKPKRRFIIKSEE